MSARKEARRSSQRRSSNFSVPPRPSPIKGERDASTIALSTNHPHSTSNQNAAAAADKPVTNDASINYPLDTRRLKQLRKLLQQTLDQCFSPDASSRLLTALPKDIHQRHALVIQRLAEKATDSIRKNIMNELEVILSEHRLAEKLGEIEYLEDRGGMLLDDGTQVGSIAAPNSDTQIRMMLMEARKAEILRLTALAEHLESENATLRDEIRDVAQSIQSAKEAVSKQQQFTDKVYATLEAEPKG